MMARRLARASAEEPLEPAPDGKKRFGHRSVWKLPTLHVTQTVELMGPDHKACLVRYVFENKGEKPHMSRSRLSARR